MVHSDLEIICLLPLTQSRSELRHELNDLPSCSLQDSSFPYPLPTLEIEQTDTSETTANPASFYYYLAEIWLRRLQNRVRHTIALLTPDIDCAGAFHIAEVLQRYEVDLQHWLDCIPTPLRFNVPPYSWPEANEPELVKLTRERYVELRELLCRAYLYICIHAGTSLTPLQTETYGAHASAGLLLSVYRLQTEKPFFRHMGSWLACRIRFNHALCLLAAARAKELGIASAARVAMPPSWQHCIGMVQDRLEVWSDQGAGIAELAVLLEWLANGHDA